MIAFQQKMGYNLFPFQVWLPEIERDYIKVLSHNGIGDKRYKSKSHLDTKPFSKSTFCCRIS